MINSSYNIVLERLRAFAEGHFYIKSFSHELLNSIDLSTRIDYPIMQVIPGTITPSPKQLSYSFDIVFADLARRKTDLELNTQEVISDMTRIALDLIFEITNGQVLFGRGVTVSEGSTITSFIDGFENTITGVTLSITINVPDQWNACIIPADWATGGTGYPSEGMRVMSIPVLDEGNFVVNAYELDFRGSGVTVTREGNVARVTIPGGGSGGGITCEDLPECEVIVDIEEAIDALQTSLTALTSTVSGLSATVGGIQNDITAIEAEQTTQNEAIAALQNTIDNLAFVESVTGDSVDNTDPLNPIVNAIPLAGTTAGNPVTGGIDRSPALSVDGTIFDKNLASVSGSNFEGFVYFDDGTIGLYQKSTDGESFFITQAGGNFRVGTNNPNFKGITYEGVDIDLLLNSSLITQQVLKSRLWNKAGVPTTTDDSTLGYVVNRSLILDTTTGIIYRCTDATAGAATWEVYYNPNATSPLLLDTIRVGSTIGAGLTRYAAVGVAGASATVVLNIAPKRIHKNFRVVTGTVQSATGALTISRLFTTYAGATVRTDTLTIPANSPIGEYVFNTATFDASAGFNMRFDIVQGTGTSAFIQGIENEYE